MRCGSVVCCWLVLACLLATPAGAGQRLPGASKGRRLPGKPGGPTTTLLRLGPNELGLLPAPLKPAALRALERTWSRVSAVSESSRMLHAVGMHYQAVGDHKRALAAYTRITADPARATYGGIDSVLYLASELLLASDPMRARRLLLRLIKNQPTSRFIPHAYLGFGLHYLDQGKPGIAVRLFDKAIQFPNSSAAGYASYLKGWSQLQLRQHQRALAALVQVTRARRRVLIPAQAHLTAAALGAAVLAYVEIGRPDKAALFFRRIGGAAEPQMLRILAGLYRRRGRHADARRIQAELAKRPPPRSRQAPGS